MTWPSEPRLTTADRLAWSSWMRAASAHAHTDAHRRRVEQARAAIRSALRERGRWACMVSAGKDSSVLGHLVAGIDPGVEWVSEKDDLDYPGERDYVERLATRCGAPLTVLEPSFSVWERFAELAPSLGAWDDIHARTSTLSAEAFYGVVENATAGRPILLGLRAEESRARAANRSSRGLAYTKRSGQAVCQPLADWKAIDVYAYAATHELELLPVYQCIALMHGSDPGRIRKSWWVGGASNAHGHVRWLAHYWPSLFARLCSVMPHARRMT